MEQLNTLDAGFLMAEDSDRNVSLAIGGIAIVEGSAPNHGQFKDILAERIQAIPRCTQMLRTQPFMRPFNWKRGTSLFDGVFHWRDIQAMPPEQRLARMKGAARKLGRPNAAAEIAADALRLVVN